MGIKVFPALNLGYKILKVIILLSIDFYQQSPCAVTGGWFCRQLFRFCLHYIFFLFIIIFFFTLKAFFLSLTPFTDDETEALRGTC